MGRRSPRGERGLKCLMCQPLPGIALSLPPRGAWIEIVSYEALITDHMSLPPRGAWIEIQGGSTLNRAAGRRSPRGERGLKSDTPRAAARAGSRSPRGERGLKLMYLANIVSRSVVAPPAGSVD